MKISRAKLAYLVDSTAAPIAATAIVSTWIAYEVGLIQDLIGFIGVTGSGYEFFLKSIPYRFYSLMTLAFVFLVSITGRDFGPMLKAEQRARRGEIEHTGADPKYAKAYEVKPGIDPKWYNGVIPLAVLIGCIFGGFFFSGGGMKIISGEVALSFKAIADLVSNADTGTVLVGSAIIGTVVAVLMAFVQKILSFEESGVVMAKSSKLILKALAIWVLAWGIGNLCKELQTSHYLVALLKDVISPAIVPLVIFGLGAGIAFATGTSWGSMAILIPTTLPLAFELGGVPLLMISLGAVLDGSVFGDHCSPISDTTIMSSIGCSCDHLTHVRTQIPYALTTMFAAAVYGYLLAPRGFPAWASLLVGIGFLYIVLRVVGRRAEDYTEEFDGALEPAAVAA